MVPDAFQRFQAASEFMTAGWIVGWLLRQQVRDLTGAPTRRHLTGLHARSSRRRQVVDPVP